MRGYVLENVRSIRRPLAAPCLPGYSPFQLTAASFDRTPQARASRLLKKALVAFFNLAKCGAKLHTEAQNNPDGPGLFCHRIHAMAQPVEDFNGLLDALDALWRRASHDVL